MWVSKHTMLTKLLLQIFRFNPSYSGCGLVRIIPLKLILCSCKFQSFLFWMWVSKNQATETSGVGEVSFNPSYSGCGLVSVPPVGAAGAINWVSILLILDVG